MLDLTTVSLLDFCNPAVKNDQQFVALCKAFDPLLQEFVATIPNNQIFCNINNQPENILDYIALYHFNVDAYSTLLPIATKITLIQNVIQDKINKGTPQRIIDILTKNFGLYAELIEWFQDAPPISPWQNAQAPHTPPQTGDPATFRINIVTSDPVTLTNAYNAIIAGKNARSYFAGFTNLYTVTGNNYTGMFLGNYDYQVITTGNLTSRY